MTYRSLESVNLGDVKTFVNPGLPDLDLDSPAARFMTDFRYVQPIIVQDDAETDQALATMKKAHVRLLLVSHGTDDEFVGVISATDLVGGKVLAYMANSQTNHREDVLVRHIMTDREHIHGLDYAKVELATIGDVLETIKNLNEQHAVVVEQLDGVHTVRGLFSTTDVVRALHIPFDVEPHAKTFFELEQVILHHQPILG